jgi:GT2 family glycosyltransferase
VGVAHAHGTLVGLLDDDCDAPATWVPELVAAFAGEPRVGVVFGNLEAGSHDAAAGFVGSYHREEPSLARHLWEQDRADGVAACMGVRRSVWEQVGGFDEMLGVGARLKSAAEGDFTLRALAAGHFVYETPRWSAVHRGFRSWDESPDTVHRYWYGTGAMVAKPLKLGQRGAWRLLARLGWRWAFGRSPVSVSLGGSAHRLSRLAAFLRGFAAGLLTPLDRSTGHYRLSRRKTGAAARRAAGQAVADRRARV